MPLLSRKRVTTATQSVDRFSTQHLSTNQISSPIAISQPLPLPPATASESNPQIENSCITKLDSTIIVKSKTPLKFSNKANIIETIGVNVAKMVSKRSNSADSPKEAKKRKNGENRITNGDTRETPTTEIEQTDLRLSTQDLEALSRLDSSMEVEPNGQMIEEEGQFNLDSPITESQFFANDSRSQFTRMYQCNAEAEMEKAKDVNGEIGHIQEITLQNFMCHSHFHLELGPRINFILGPNGSGKSAILNGIVLGLGGRASNTNRASGLASFIKTGENRAKIVIRLSNYSETSEMNVDRYLPEKYGKHITIERVILASGSSSYKIKSDCGKVISEKKEELDNILKHFAIIIDNPITVLTQEVSKNFLNTKSPHDKFKFFMKATQLESIKNDYKESFDNKESSEKLLEEKKELIKIREKDLAEAERKVRIIETLRDSSKKIYDLHCEALWANINESKKSMANTEVKLSGINSKLEKINSKIEREEEELKTFSDSKAELVEKLQSLVTDIGRTNTEYNEAKNEAREFRKVLTEKESNLRITKNELNSHIKEISNLKKRIETIEANNEGETNFEEKLSSLKCSIEAKRDEERELRSEFNLLHEKNEQRVQEKIHLNEEERKIRAQISSYEAELDRLKQGAKNRINRYGNKFAELQAQVNQAQKRGLFKRKVYGPVGEYIHLEDQSAALAVECCLKTFLKAFVVDNVDDSRELKRIMDRVFNTAKQPTIVIRKFSEQQHDVSANEVQTSRHRTFLKLMNIEEPAVANCLIDHLRVEQTLYIPNFKEAQNQLLYADRVPRNCLQAYTSGGDLMFASSDKSDYKCYPNRHSKFAKILVADCQKATVNYRKSIDELNTKQLSTREKIANLEQEIEVNRQSIGEINGHVNRLRGEIGNFEKELKEVKIKANSVKPVEVIALKDEVSKLESERLNLQSEAETLTEERNQLKEQYVQLEKQSDIRCQAYQSMSNSREPIKNQIEKIKSDIADIITKVDSFNSEKSDLVKTVKEFERKLKDDQEDIERSRSYALEKGGGVVTETTRSNEQIMEEIKRIEMIIKENASMADENQQNEIINRHNELHDLVQQLNQDLSQLKNYLKLLTEALVMRKGAYNSWRLHTMLLVNHVFEEILFEKGFTGKIDITFKDTMLPNAKIKKGQQLEIIIKPREGKQFFESQGEVQTIYSSTKSLSGGERSYSTVAFIISLWEPTICASPFRMLDEVDVFMDMVTRKIAIDTLVEFASYKSSKQYIFFSPLRIQHIHRPECVKIFQMPEIQRD